MLALMNRILDWFRSLFWKEEMELTLVGLQYSGKTTFVNVIAVRTFKFYQNSSICSNISICFAYNFAFLHMKQFSHASLILL